MTGSDKTSEDNSIHKLRSGHCIPLTLINRIVANKLYSLLKLPDVCVRAKSVSEVRYVRVSVSGVCVPLLIVVTISRRLLFVAAPSIL